MDKRLRDVHGVVFDLDGTLLDRRGSFVRFIRDQWERFGHFLHAVDREQYVQTLVDLDRDGYAPRKELYTGAVARHGLSSSLAATLLEDYRAGFPQACLLFPDAAQTLAALRAAGFKLGLITNGSVPMQSAKLACLAMAPMFDVTLISDEVGISKPDRRIFDLALKRLDLVPADAVFVGDHPEIDIAGARAAGMTAIWRKDPEASRAVEADAAIEELSELLILLGVKPGQI